ncbi:hypothetical protein GUY44_11920 [Pimelobacter simplex]|uniref:hypothetical protein n=1 Tax=Nocardioides simplex TaxID=2045 RepID=UPI0005360DD6|nr:hypothetical protein [Pimelobacter simplex]MCG8151189.1 hypothetical protein [Pimelobacter simplex]GEB17218.1 hypothetical protein NSI01_55330 [Pimelobacter simplex]SFN18656.1 hypothetical protein SAMN05421671_0004 [Pimelobacter simplex]
MATIKVAPSGAIEAVYIDGLDITSHILASPAPVITATGDDPGGIWALDLRIALERPRKAAKPKVERVGTMDVRAICEESDDE